MMENILQTGNEHRQISEAPVDNDVSKKDNKHAGSERKNSRTVAIENKEIKVATQIIGDGQTSKSNAGNIKEMNDDGKGTESTEKDERIVPNSDAAIKANETDIQVTKATITIDTSADIKKETGDEESKTLTLFESVGYDIKSESKDEVVSKSDIIDKDTKIVNKEQIPENTKADNELKVLTDDNDIKAETKVIAQSNKDDQESKVLTRGSTENIDTKTVTENDPIDKHTEVLARKDDIDEDTDVMTKREAEGENVKKEHTTHKTSEAENIAKSTFETTNFESTKTGNIKSPNTVAGHKKNKGICGNTGTTEVDAVKEHSSPEGSALCLDTQMDSHLDKSELVTDIKSLKTEESVLDVNESVPTKMGSNIDSRITESGQLEMILTCCDFQLLPPLPKKVVRIFISSTFTDTKEERNALMQHVYPKLSEYCRETHGLEFQIVDMRWGVPEQASDSHSTTELCIQEIKKCKQVSAGPNFVAILGDKYGYRPIPSDINCDTFEALSSTVEHDADWELVTQWYKQDVNSVPAVYILQPISSMIQDYHNSENAELRKAAWDKWNSINQRLTLTLRKAATMATEQGKITAEEKQRFFMSVTESEITSAVLQDNVEIKSSCYVMIRKIPDIHEHLHEDSVPRFTDISDSKQVDEEAQNLLTELRDIKIPQQLPESNLTKLDIEWSKSGASVSVEQFQDVDVAKYANKFLTDKELIAFRHKEYIDNVCTEFFKKICKLVNQGKMKQMQIYDELTVEILQHYHLSKMRCEMFEGREDLLNEIKQIITSTGENNKNVIVIYGNSGCGKTSVMAKIMEQVCCSEWKLGESCVVVARFLGTTTKTSNVHQLLVSMCQQIAKAFGIIWKEPEQLSELIKSFYRVLENASETKPILLLLDSIDQLMPVYNAYKLEWLPEELPPHVKLICSTIDEGYKIYDTFIERYFELQTFEVKPLGESLGLSIIRKWLSNDGRTISLEQANLVKIALCKCSLPLYARIVYDNIKKWRSYETPTLDHLETTVKGAISQLFQSLEEKFGALVVKHCLSYMTASRYGLSEAELEHVLSLDDTLLNKIFRLWMPPVRRIPPLIWTRIRSEIHSYIVERSADDVLVLYWYHRQFIQATRSRYLQDEEFVKHIHNHLFEYFSGKWSGGKNKPFKYTEQQMKRFKLSNLDGVADRKVPSQPYWSQHTATNKETIRFNKRRISELPYHLIKVGNYEGLKELTFFNYSWLYSKLKSTSAQQMLEEIEIFMQANKFMKSDVETKLLFVNLQLIRPYIIEFPDSLSLELSARLAKHISKYPHIKRLVSECDSVGNLHCPLVPLTSCFETAGLGYTQNINFRKIEPWHKGGTFCCSQDFKKIYIIDYNEEGLPILSTWEIATGEKICQVFITKPKEEGKLVTDMYYQTYIVNQGKFLLACYKQRMDSTYKKEIQPGGGFFDIIDLDTGAVKSTHETFMYRDEFFDPILYCTDSYVSYSFGWKMPLVNILTDLKQNFNRPTLLSSNDKYFIVCGKDQTLLREYETKTTIGEFDVQEHQIGVAASENFRTIAMIGRETNQIKVFDLINKKLDGKQSSQQLIKCKHTFKLDEKIKSEVASIYKPIIETVDNGRVVERTNNTVVMKMSPGGQHVMVAFIGWKWSAYLWTIWTPGKYNARFVGAITPYRMSCSVRLPQFNFDGSTLIYAKKSTVMILSTDTLEVVNEYHLKEDVKDFHVSKTENKIVVMLQKSVMILDVLKNVEETDSKLKKTDEVTTEVVLAREIVKSKPLKELIANITDENISIETVNDLIEEIDIDRVSSATSRAKEALFKYVTPNGDKAVHFHRKLQVIDPQNEVIKYTPRSGENLLKTIIGKDGEVSSEVINLDPLKSGKQQSLVLKSGDRIVNESNKVKFRVQKENDGHFQVGLVPSVISVYTLDELKLKRLLQIQVFKEQILDVSNSYIVTSKSTNKGYFINIFSLLEGKLLATHQFQYHCGCAKFSFDEIQLFAVDQSLTLKIFQGPLFISTEINFKMMIGELESAFIVKNIIHFPQNREVLLIQYGPEGPDVVVKSRYLFVNIISQEKSQEMQVTPSFSDVTSDGKYGVDTDLKVYDLEKGKVITKITYSRKLADNERERQLQVVLNRRKQYTELVQNLLLSICMTPHGFIAFVNRQDNTMHVAKLNKGRAELLVSCFVHMTNMSEKVLSARLNESVLTLTTTSNTMAFVINQNCQHKYNYQNQHSRMQSILSSLNQEKQMKDVLVNDISKTNSVFYRKKALLQAIAQEDSKDEKLKQGRFLSQADIHKPTVLVVGETILCSNIFKSDYFSPNLSTEKMSVQNAADALIKLKDNPHDYDVIILQLITDDVVLYDASICVKRISLVVDLAREKAKIVLISLAPPRTDNKEYNDRIKEVNDKLALVYTSACKDGKHLHICKNSNLQDSNGKQIGKLFKDSVNLSPLGLRKICRNLKEILAPLLGLHHI